MFRRSVPPSLPWKFGPPLAAATPPTIPFFSPVPNAQRCTAALHHPPRRGAAERYHGPHDDNPLRKKTMRWGENLPCCPSLLRCTTMLRPTRVLRCLPSSSPPSPPPLSADPLTLDDITALPPLPRCVPEPCEGVTKWSDVDKLHREADRKKYVDAWLVEYNKNRPAHAKFEWSDTFRTAYAPKFTSFATLLEQGVLDPPVFWQQLAKLLTRSTAKTLVQRLSREAKSVLRDQFTVLTSADLELKLNSRVPKVTPPAGIRLIRLELAADKASLLGGASGSGKTHAAIQAATDFVQVQGKEGGCVLYYSLNHNLTPTKKNDHDAFLEGWNSVLNDQNAFLKEVSLRSTDGLLTIMKHLDQEIQRFSPQKQKHRHPLRGHAEQSGLPTDEEAKQTAFATTEDTLRERRADVFLKYIEKIVLQCTTLFGDLKCTTEAIRVALVLDEVGDKPYLVRAACSFFNRSIGSVSSATTLQKRLGLSDTVELAVVLCGTGVGADGCLGGSDLTSFRLSMLTPTSAETLWTTLCTTYPEVRVADRVSPTCRAMGRSNARMAMLLVECLQTRHKDKHQQPLNADYANVVATAETVACQAAMRFKDMNGFESVSSFEMLRLYGQALRACVWHTDPEKDLEEPLLLTKYGAITDLRRIDAHENCLVAANGSKKEGRCFTIAPAMMAFFRIMLSYNCLIPIDVTGVSFEHAMLHFVGAALRSCAGRSVRDFLSLIGTDAMTTATIPGQSERKANRDVECTLTIPSNINETLLMLSLGHRKFDKKRIESAFALKTNEVHEDARKAEKEESNKQAPAMEMADSTQENIDDKKTKKKDDHKEACATKEVLDLAFTVSSHTLTADCPVVLLNGDKAAAADIIVIVPGVLVCHVQCKDYVDDAKLVAEAKNTNKKTFVAEYEKMTMDLHLSKPFQQYCVLATTSPGKRLEKQIQEHNKESTEEQQVKLMVLRVPRISSTTTATTSSPSNCAFLQSLVGLCKADIETGMIVQRAEKETEKK